MGEHLILEIELPCMYVDDIEGLRAEYLSDFDSESDLILNCIGEPKVVRLRTEISGEKDSEVIEVWGMVRGARIEDVSRGYGPGDLTDDQLAKNGWKLLRDTSSCEWCDHGLHSAAEALSGSSSVRGCSGEES